MKQYYEYLKKNPIGCILTVAVLALSYAKQAFSTSFYIDSENLVNGDQDNDGEITAADIMIVYSILLGN